MQFPSSTKWSVVSLIFLTSIIVLPLTYANHKAGTGDVIEKTYASSGEEVASTAQNNVAATDTPDLAVYITTPEPTKTPAVKTEATEKASGVSRQQEEIDAYIRTIFGKDAKVAIAVNRVECNPKNKAYPRCVYHTEHEYSVGIFQINLFNKSHAIHAAKVPGKTMDDKIESLKDPFINTLVAHKIFTDSGFQPWAGYTSGRYLDHMGE
jgi:hypothetical protein